jgi:hypothetical protein
MTIADLMTPPGIIHTTQNAVSSVASVIPPPAPPIPGTAGALVPSVSTPDPFTPLFASGISNLVSPPALNLPSVPGLGIPLPSEVPTPSDLICIGTDWSASQGDSVPHPAAPVDRRDRW